MSIFVALALAAAPPPTPTDPGEPPALTGAGALVAGGALQLASIGLHVASFEMMRDSCGLEQMDLAAAKFAGDTPARAEREIVKVGGLGIACLALGDQAVRLRIGAGLASLASLSLVTTGGLLMGRSDAYHDRVVHHRDRKGKAWTLGVAGGVLLGSALATWLGTRIAMVARKSGCKQIDCFTTYDLVSFQVATAVGIAGAGMLAWGASYQRRFKLLAERPRFGVAPSARGTMLSVSGRF
ncbi:MAG TPA: hypothetical protein VG755_13400 [Nannocystaceae bacterium]|nr:hypothetical protein [Nannocystaceae bacterium]